MTEHTDYLPRIGRTLVVRLSTVEGGEAVTRYYREQRAALARLHRVRRSGGHVMALDAALMSPRQALTVPPDVPADAWRSLLGGHR